MFSKRSRVSGGPNALARARERARREGRAVLDLTESNPTRAGIPYPARALCAALATEEALTYRPHPLGLLASRRAVGRRLAAEGHEVAPEHIMLTASTSEAYAFLFKLLCDPGDEVLAPEPSYPLFEHLARYEGVRLVPYRLSYDGAWHLDPDSLRRSRSPRARAVLVVSPNNPTGSYLKREELLILEQLALPIIADEVFASYPLVDDAERVSSILTAREALVFSLGGLSKLAALPQMKLSWIAAAGPAAARSAALERLELIGDTYLSVGAPVQHALPLILETSDAARAAILRRLKGNLARARHAVSGTPTSLLRAEGGWYAVLRLPAIRSEESWVLGLLDERDVLVQPGWFYDFAEEPFLVVSLLTPEGTFRQGMERLVAYVAEHSG